MEFFESEFRKLLPPDRAETAIYGGRTCYLPLGGPNSAKIEFASEDIYTHYDKLRVTILHRQFGMVDELDLRFSEVLGRKPVKVGKRMLDAAITPYILDFDGYLNWFQYTPTTSDYEILSTAISGYVDLFREPDRSLEERKQPLDARVTAAEDQSKQQFIMNRPVAKQEPEKGANKPKVPQR